MSIKIGNQDIAGIYLGNQEIAGVYLGNQIIWESSITGTLDNGNISFELKKGVLTFRGTGIIPVIENNPTDQNIQKLYNEAPNIIEIIVEDSVAEISQYAFGCFYNLKKITLPFIGKNANANNVVYPFGYIFSENNISIDEKNKTYQVKSYVINNFNKAKDYRLSQLISSSWISSYTSYIPNSLEEIVANGGQYNKSYLSSTSFYNCELVKNIFINTAVENIQGECLSGCFNLTSLTLPFLGETGLKMANSREERVQIGALFYKEPSSVFSTQDIFPTIGGGISPYSGDEKSSDYGRVRLVNTLKNITILGYDLPWYNLKCFNNIYSSLKIKLLSKNTNKPIKKIGSYCFPGEKNLKLKVYIPITVTDIGIQQPQEKGTSNKEVYYQGSQQQWNDLIKQGSSYGYQFENWKIYYNQKEQDFDNANFNN